MASLCKEIRYENNAYCFQGNPGLLRFARNDDEFERLEQLLLLVLPKNTPRKTRLLQRR